MHAVIIETSSFDVIYLVIIRLRQLYHIKICFFVACVNLFIRARINKFELMLVGAPYNSYFSESKNE